MESWTWVSLPNRFGGGLSFYATRQQQAGRAEINSQPQVGTIYFLFASEFYRFAEIKRNPSHDPGSIRIPHGLHQHILLSAAFGKSSTTPTAPHRSLADRPAQLCPKPHPASSPLPSRFRATVAARIRRAPASPARRASGSIRNRT